MKKNVKNKSEEIDAETRGAIGKITVVESVILKSIPAS